MKKVVYFDMDGVLADWVQRFEEEFDVSYKEYNENMNWFPGIKDQIANMPDFYSAMKPMKWVKVLLEWIDLYGDDISFQILTSVGKKNPHHVIAQKKVFLSELGLGDIPFNYVYSSKEKAYYADGENTILIDDREKSLNPWKEAGGIPVDGNDLGTMFYVEEWMDS